MIPPQLPAMIMAEVKAVFGRWSGRGALVLALVVGLGAVGSLELADRMADNMQANGSPARQMLLTDWATSLAWALNGRNFFVLPLLLVLAGASSLSGEMNNNTLRELLVRPVPRWSVVAAKVAALAVLSAFTLTITSITASIGGAVMFATEGEIGPVLLGFAMSWLSDLGLITMTLLVASFSRSVGGVVVGLALYLMSDWLFGKLMSVLGTFGVEWAPLVHDVLPGTALQAWSTWDAGFEPKRVGALLLLIAITWIAATVRVQRADVP